MRVAFLVWFAVAPMYAHVVSMSSGELKVEDRKATYELRMPMYEIPNMINPSATLLDRVRFVGGRRTSESCQEEDGIYVCQANYEFEQPLPDKLDVDCTLFQVTVPNHVHLLHAVQGTNSDQVVFDSRITQIEVRFHPPSVMEVFVREAAAGMARVLTSVTALLFVIALGFAARRWPELILYAALFLVGEWIARPLAPRLPLALSPGFLEAAVALTVSYLAIDVLLLPEARARWVLMPVFGLVHGLSFAAFPVNYLTGASMVQLGGMGLIAAIAFRLPKFMRPYVVGAVLAGSLTLFVRLLLG